MGHTSRNMEDSGVNSDLNHGGAASKGFIGEEF